jgi:uncharacterized protein (TIGR00730 family)
MPGAAALQLRPDRTKEEPRKAPAMETRMTDGGHNMATGAAVPGGRGIRSLCVYCGSAGAVDERYRAAASELGDCLGRAGIALVFGGGRIGLMGLAADAALAAGGRVIGVIPEHLREAELAHPGASELIVTANMHERKRVMAERADAFAVLPGGIGTLDEMFEILTWRQLGLHDKPVFVVDIAGYWRPLRALFDHLVAERFVAPLEPRLLTIVPTVASLMDALAITRTVSATRSDVL